LSMKMGQLSANVEPWDAGDRIIEVGESKIAKVSSGVHPVINTKFH